VTTHAREPRVLLSNTWYVDSSFTGTPAGTQSQPFTSISAALGSAGSGDTILVETGDGYNESDSIGASNLTIEADASTGAAPVLDGSTPSVQTAPGFTIQAGSSGINIQGFTIQHVSVSNGPGAGILNKGTVAVSDCTISDNSAGGSGGGVRNNGTMTLTDCTISANSMIKSSPGFGGGITNDGTLTLSGCTVSGTSPAG
jgi:Right handed beta helix region